MEKYQCRRLLLRRGADGRAEKVRLVRRIDERHVLVENVADGGRCKRHVSTLYEYKEGLFIMLRAVAEMREPGDLIRLWNGAERVLL